MGQRHFLLRYVPLYRHDEYTAPYLHAGVYVPRICAGLLFGLVDLLRYTAVYVGYRVVSSIVEEVRAV